MAEQFPRHEDTPAPPDARDGRTRVVPVERQLPEPEEGVVKRLVAEVRNLTTDAAELAELRLKKLQIEVEERIDDKVNRLVDNAITGVLLAIGGLWILVALSLGVGELLGHAAWGFLVVGAVLAVAGLVVKKAQPDLVEVGSKKAIVDEDHLEPGAPDGVPHQPKEQRDNKGEDAPEKVKENLATPGQDGKNGQR